MTEHSGFRGLAGEVIVSFVMPAAIFQAIPVLIFFGLCAGAVVLLLPDDLFPLDMLLILIMVSFAVSRYAIPASRGDFESGWFSDYNSNSESLNFSIRYIVVTLAWAIPSAALMFAMSEFGSGFSLGLDAFSLLQSGFTGFLTLILLIVFVFAPTLGFIATTATSEAREVVQPSLWRHLLVDQRPNLVVFYSSLIGGVVTFWLIYALPLAFITVVGFAISAGLGGFLAAFVFLLPVAMAPVLIGRLCGALLRGETEESLSPQPPVEPVPAAPPPKPVTSTATPAAPSTDTAPAPTPDPGASDGPPPPGSPAAKNAFSQMLKKVENTSDLQIQNALLLTKNRFMARPDDPYVAGEICLLSIKAGQADDAVAAATRAIGIALASGADNVALKCYVEMKNAGFPVELERDQQQKVVSLLVKSSRFAGALDLMLELDVVTAQRLKTLAELAIKNDRKKDAITILNYLRGNFADADFIGELAAKVDAMN